MSNAVTVAIDLGFGDVKSIFDGSPPRKTPTVIVPKPANMNMAGIVGVNSEFSMPTYRVGGVEYLVGHAALEYVKQSGANTGIQRRIHWLIDHLPLFSAHACHGEDTSNTKMVVGIPLADYHNHCSRVKDVLSPYYSNVEVHAQGIGILVDHLSRVSGKQSGVVLDVGYNTAIVVQFIDNKPVGTGCRQYDQQGVSEAAILLVQKIEALCGAQIKLPEANAYITKSGGLFLFGGKSYELSQLVAESITEYAKQLIDSILIFHEKTISRSGQLVLAGGGAYLISDYLKKSVDVPVIISPEPEFANVRGYYILGTRG